ncbi:hypothetical protein DEO72_LG8g1264 [Vigna unguiculata]|uniref:Uncharacterized protein n=1 Tax=Vigna unguiculata TaxID=3917 RepID=A0A4D6MNZ0_VIGUN|nr:hypothetical protein DEO72_LG8g1264 [Vigna unguiculata]
MAFVGDGNIVRTLQQCEWRQRQGFQWRRDGGRKMEQRTSMTATRLLMPIDVVAGDSGIECSVCGWWQRWGCSFTLLL